MYEIATTFAREHLYYHALLVILSAAAIAGAMAVDLIFGVRKAKELGIARTSTLYKKTCEKAKKYFSPFIELLFIDLIGCVFVPAPAFSMLWAAYCVFCEFISVREKAWQKAELRKAEQTMRVVIENKDDVAKMAATLLTLSKEKDKPKTE